MGRDRAERWFTRLEVLHGRLGTFGNGKSCHVEVGASKESVSFERDGGRVREQCDAIKSRSSINSNRVAVM